MTTPEIREAGVKQWLDGLTAAELLQIARARWTREDLADLIRMSRVERREFIIDSIKQALHPEPPTWNVI